MGTSGSSFRTGRSEYVKLQVTVAGFLAEAKGKVDLSNDHSQTRMMAMEINCPLRAGETALQVGVFLVAGANQPAGTNQKDFAFLLEDLGSRIRNFKAFFGADSCCCAAFQLF